MKVCHLVASTGLGRGDAYVDLVNAQAQYAEVCLVAPYGAKFAGNLHDNVKLFEYRSSNSRFNPKLYFELYNLIRKIAPDVVHTHFAKASEIFHRLGRYLSVTHVATKHNPRKGKIFNRLKYVVAVSQGVAESISHDNVEVIYNGILPEKVARRKNNNLFTVCAIGRLDKIKRFDLLIDEMAKVDGAYLLQIVGDGTEKTALEQKITANGLDDKIKLLGFRSDVPQLLADSDLQLMSSSSEGFSLAMVEAIFYSRVFVSTRVPGCIEILPEKLMVEGTDISSKVTDVMLNYEKYVQAFQEVKGRYQNKLDIKQVAKHYIDYYKKIVLSDRFVKTE